jgi:hypothetical protein
MRKLKILMVAGAATMLSSCDLSQIPGLDGKLSLDDSKAVGAACRHSGRALEDCFALNPNTHQSGVFDGWRDMNDYMLANQIEVVRPEIRNSMYRPDKVSVEQRGTNAQPMDPGSNPADASGDAVPLAQGRQRWSPKDPLGAADVTPSPQPSAEKAEDTVQAPVVSKDEPAVAEQPAVDAPARPWERKKDPKKHT